MAAHALADVYRGLKEVGLTKGQVRAILPDWWDPEVATTDSGLWETAILLGRRLSLEAEALIEGRVQPCESISRPRFKHTARVSPDQLRPAAMIASGLAKAILGSIPVAESHGRISVKSVRAELLKTPNRRIDFDAILDFAWNIGIPVIPLPYLPKGIRKMDAAAIKVGSRPAIILALRTNSKAWISFLLAHELGHICLGHIPENGALFEGSLTDTSEFDAQSQMDQQERSANEFALELLGGHEVERQIAQWGHAMPAIELAAKASELASALKTAPGHLVLRHAFMTHAWPEARIALKFLTDDLDAQPALVNRMTREIDMQSISDDLRDYLEQITGLVAEG
ncbi:ImmA/IrrE family metallo-endopeptidase [Geothrix sp. SG200]|uniref:ImmA/IrrE family metallo-endopeptidase n=1 Tax=Geothrix sp. SG200 TaxID=2922865 RepID=UPI001FAE4CCD|nr:ImmA/IrrE family metallo-endopeptidase [Geothrix sp. SG200]